MSKRDMPSSGNNEWETPPEIFYHWNALFSFQMDVAATAENSKVFGNFITKEQDATRSDIVWEHRNWCNPPYGRGLILPFVRKAHAEAKEGHLTVMLLPVATGTKWWQQYVGNGNADHVYFYPHRINFIRDGFVVRGVAFDPCIVIWGLHP